MNCVNCGAPPRVGSRSCSYCETALDHLVPEADHAGYHLILNTIKVTSSDMRKVDILALCQGPYTAGQVREILAQFSSDMRRVDAAALLISKTTNPAGLLACANLFDSDMRRTDFVALLPRSATRTRGTPSPPRPTEKERLAQEQKPGYVMMVLVATLAVIAIANLMWMVSR